MIQNCHLINSMLGSKLNKIQDNAKQMSSIEIVEIISRHAVIEEEKQSQLTLDRRFKKLKLQMKAIPNRSIISITSLPTDWSKYQNMLSKENGMRICIDIEHALEYERIRQMKIIKNV